MRVLFPANHLYLLFAGWVAMLGDILAGEENTLVRSNTLHFSNLYI